MRKHRVLLQGIAVSLVPFGFAAMPNDAGAFTDRCWAGALADRLGQRACTSLTNPTPVP
jgi:hypothetical protein